MTRAARLRILVSGLLAITAPTVHQHAATDLSGTYDISTLTPLQRPEALGNNLYLSKQQAAAIEARMAGAMAADSAKADPNRGAPPAGEFTRGYNLFWVEPGTGAIELDGRFRTSLLTHPENGRIPPMTPAGAARLQGFLDAWRIIWRNPDPTAGITAADAWWLHDGDPDGPYDHLEQRPLAERCIIGSRSTAGPPMLPNFYNNYKRIVQTPDAVMILTEMNHDARVIRLGGTHRPAHIRTWLGDSVGRFEGDTLVVQTRNFVNTPALSGADENLQVTERFTRLPNGDLRYAFEVDDPTIWSAPWGGEFPWRAATAKVYEFACHEGNYALGNIMRGARLLEAEARNGEAR